MYAALRAPLASRPHWSPTTATGAAAASSVLVCAATPFSCKIRTTGLLSAAFSMARPSSSSSMRLHAFVSGRVQGVFFRNYTKAKALELGVTGWVRNRRDGRVEVVAEGYEQDLQQLLTWLHTGSPEADVTGVDSNWSSATGEFDEFDKLWTV